MSKQNYLALLRGINVGGHHKVPMAELRGLLEKMGFKQVSTLLNSGNVIFQATENKSDKLEKKLAQEIEQAFGFAVPVMIRKGKEIEYLIAHDPFKGVESIKNIHFYLTFLKDLPSEIPLLPWQSEDNSIRIVHQHERVVCSVVDTSSSKTPDAMKVLEKLYSKNITTRSWNTILKVGERLKTLSSG